MLRHDAPLAIATTAAIRAGAIDDLRQLLTEHPGLARERVVDAGATQRTLLHLATDWPGHLPRVAETLAVLIAAGAEVDGRCVWPHGESALHWAASSDDVVALDVLLDAGATIDLDGAVIGGGTPLDDAVAFSQWKTARRLVERGAAVKLWNAAALGLVDRVATALAAAPPPAPADVTNAFWCACHGGQRATAEQLLEHGADRDWIGHDHLTPLGAAQRAGADALVAWLRERGAR